MKLLFAIIQNDDAKPLTRALVDAGISVTRISSTGGFLSGGNTTLMIGVSEEQLPSALEEIKAHSSRRQIVTVDRAIENEQSLVAHLEQRLGADVKHITVMKLDLVNDTTMVDVRYRLDPSRSMVPATVVEELTDRAPEKSR